ncbi:hypothetical protein [Ferrimonas marina]|uniref:Uncharacterized protein n=1 Tax=Ferrimonas marina TaxID=299255 RepID=A0A1M5UBB5_9GAMM|nr:hypothetical protein [Ferrimonas marina]SHH60208.1 hypothetical protein SAMN02745129_2485 [Ferrimonas marina]
MAELKLDKRIEDDLERFNRYTRLREDLDLGLKALRKAAKLTSYTELLAAKPVFADALRLLDVLTQMGKPDGGYDKALPRMVEDFNAVRDSDRVSYRLLAQYADHIQGSLSGLVEESDLDGHFSKLGCEIGRELERNRIKVMRGLEKTLGDADQWVEGYRSEGLDSEDVLAIKEQLESWYPKFQNLCKAVGASPIYTDRAVDQILRSDSAGDMYRELGSFRKQFRDIRKDLKDARTPQAEMAP